MHGDGTDVSTHWVTSSGAQDEYVCMLHDSAPTSPLQRAEALDRVRNAFAAAGRRLCVLRPTQHAQHGGQAPALTPAGAAAAAGYLRDVLGVQSLDTCVAQTALDSAGRRVTRDMLISALSLALAPSTALGQGVGVGVGCVVPLTGAVRLSAAQLRLDVAAELSAAVPLLLRWLCTHRPDKLTPPVYTASHTGDTAAVGAETERGQGSSTGTPMERVAGVLAQLLVVSVPGLQDQLSVDTLGVQTEVSVYVHTSAFIHTHMHTYCASLCHIACRTCPWQ